MKRTAVINPIVKKLLSNVTIDVNISSHKEEVVAVVTRLYDGDRQVLRNCYRMENHKITDVKRSRIRKRLDFLVGLDAYNIFRYQAHSWDLGELMHLVEDCIADNLAWSTNTTDSDCARERHELVTTGEINLD